MTQRLPYSRVVDVNFSRNSNFPARRGFGTGLFLTTIEIADTLDATNRTKIYSTMDEVVADHAANTDVYQNLNTFFAQSPTPNRAKVGFVGVTPGTSVATDLQTELDAIFNLDQDFYAVLVPVELRDDAMLDGLIDWVESRSKIAMIDSNDVLLEDETDTTNIAARNKGTVERTAVFYHTDATEYLSAAAWAYMATRNFDDSDSAYTVKFKPAATVSAVNIGTDALTAVTGFVESVGMSEAVGHCANTLIDIGGQDFMVEGSMLSQNVFLDEIHASDYLVARTEEETLALFLNNARIEFTDQGLQQLASAPRSVMNQAIRAGLIATDLNQTTGDYEPAVIVTVPSVFDVPESQRNARISPAISVRFRYAGAVHFTTINYTMTF